MAIETTSGLVEAVRALGLLDGPLADVFARRAAASADADALCAEAEREGWLTRYQSRHLLARHGDMLKVGPYRIRDILGAGGAGEVYLARHARLRRLAALKVLRAERLGDAVAVGRFLREAEAAARLAHPNIVAVYDAGEVGETHYLAMEYIDGVDLARLSHDVGPLPPQIACDFARQAALGLHHAHEQGLVHRDVKPANLLVSLAPGAELFLPASERYAGGTVKVLDMGLVSLGGRPPDGEQLTKKGVVLGTVDYLAPEQARNSSAVDRRADLYSLGCTLYHLLAGRPPFGGTYQIQTVKRHSDEPPAPIAGVSSAIQAVLHKMMAKRPDDRYSTASEVADALAPFAGPELPSAEEVAPPTEQSKTPRRWFWWLRKPEG